MLASKIKGRYGQTATNSAIFIAVTAAVILLYILALPPEDRAELLDDGSGSYISYGGSGAQIPAGRAPAIKALLFSVDAIHVDYLEKPEVSHKINAFTLRTLSEAATIKQFSSVQLSGNIFSSDVYEERFYVEPSDLRNLLLSFSAPKRDGELDIYVNDILIFSGPVEKTSPEPIVIAQDVLLPGENVLRFEAPASGIVFWSSNAFRLTNLLLSAIIEDKTLSSFDQTFTISDAEYQLMKTATLSFLLSCQSDMQTPLDVLVNGVEVYSSVPFDCGRILTFEVDPALLRLGANKVSFSSLRSTYLIEQGNLVSQLSKPPESLFYFSIPKDVFEAIYLSGSQAYLRMRFTDDLSLKRGVVIVNGFPQTFETDLGEIEIAVSTKIIDGTNSIKIQPLDRSIDIAHMEVVTR